VTNRKMSAEQAAEEGALVGEPYTPPNRPAVFDVPAYDDIADLQLLFKRFANTAVANGGDSFNGIYNLTGKLFINGGEITARDELIVADRTSDFRVLNSEADSHTRFMVFSDTDVICTVPDDIGGRRDGTIFSVVQTGTGKVIVFGEKVVGTLRTGGKFTTLEIMWHKGFWWCLSGGGSGGGGDGTPATPELDINANFTQITWEPVSGTGGPTLGYGYSVEPEDGIVCSLSGTKLTIDAVQEDIEFTFSVWGVNTAGRGDAGKLTYTWSGLAAPAITATSVPAGIKINWTKVSGATDYQISWKRKADTVWQYQKSGDAAEFTISPLLDQVPFEVRVASATLNVTSPYSNIVEVTPGPGYADDMTLAQASGNQVRITNWKSSNIYKVVSCTAGSATISGDLVTTNDGNTVVTLSVQLAEGAPSRLAYYKIKQYTYHSEQKCDPTSRFAGPNCFYCDGECKNC